MQDAMLSGRWKDLYIVNKDKQICAAHTTHKELWSDTIKCLDVQCEENINTQLLLLSLFHLKDCGI